MSFSVKSIFSKTLLTLFTASVLLSPSLSAKEMTQQERNEMAAKLIPIISMLLMDDGDTISNTQSLKKTGQTTIYYTHDDGYYEKGVTPNYTRNATSEVVTDHVTGLEWQDDAEAQNIIKNWAEAKAYCTAKGGGWRLPSIQELQDIVVDGAYNPSIDTTAFVNYSTSNGYWSSTTYASSTSYAWIVYFYYGYTSSYSKSSTGNVRCVR